jgi:ribosome-associated translation inhibitor RaiA
MSREEISEFIESFSTEQLEKVMKFFESMPRVRHVVDVVNPKTKVKSEVLLEGLESFLE